jgi:hypothetical protein
MLEKIFADSTLWLICYAIGGWLFGATAARLRMPHDIPGRLAARAIEPEMLLGGMMGLAAFLALAWVGGNVYAQVCQVLDDTVVGAIVQVVVGAMRGAILGGTLALVIVVFSFQDLLVAFLDHFGAPVLFGGVIGGAVGAVWTTIMHSSGQHWMTRALVVATAGVGGIVIGLVTAFFCVVILLPRPHK